MNVLGFEWDKNKEILNVKKHLVSFEEAKYAFFDEKRIIAVDQTHSTENETRYFCFGRILNNEIVTVRFVLKNHKIRIFGAGYWRKGRKEYETKNKIH